MEHFSTTQKQRSWIQPYYESFDGLRGLAILAVLLCHYGHALWMSEVVKWAWVGVDLFFVLSGFLITGILFDSQECSNYYGSFYKRRALRIFPLYFGLLFLIYLATWVSHTVSVRGAFALNLFYLTNLATPFLNWRTHNPTVISFLYYPTKTPLEISVGVFWTLCMEEQFYLVWPMLIRRLRTRERLLRFCLGAIVFVPLLRLVLLRVAPAQALEHNLLYFATYTRCDELFMGAALALWLRGAQLSQVTLRKRAYTVLSLSLLVLFIGYKLVPGGDVFHVTNPFVSTLGFSLIGLMASACLMLSLDRTHPFARLARSYPLQHLGKVSYGVYVLHNLPLSIFALYLDRGLRDSHLAPLYMVSVLLLIYGVAFVSFRYFESPITRLGRRQPRPASRPAYVSEASPQVSVHKIPLFHGHGSPYRRAG